MAQTGYTPIKLYASTTPAAVPLAANLDNTNGAELAINTADGKLFYKDSGGSVQTIAYKNVPISTLSGAGTGVLTALGVNVGTAGAFVVNGGALGTPTSGTLTNATGLPIVGGTTGTLSVARGGLGLTTIAALSIPVANTLDTYTTVTPSAGQSVRINAGGTAWEAYTPSTGSGTVTSVSWTGGIVSIANATTTPAFTIAGTSGGIPYFSSGTTWATSAALDANAIVLGGGAGAAPATTTTGTGVVTAIGNAVNTTNGLVTQTATLTASALLLGGGSGTGISSTTTGTGVVTALGNNANATGGFATIDGVATLTNKRIDPRVSSAASTASLTPDISSYDQYCLTAQAAGLTVNAPTGTPVDGNKLTFRILDNGGSQTISWNATYTAIGVTLPTATTAGKTTYVGCIYNANNTRWDVVAVTTQA